MALFFIAASFAHAAPLPANPPDSTSLRPAPSAAATARTNPSPAVSWVPSDSGRAAGKGHRPRTTDYPVAPGVTWHYEKPRPFRWVGLVPRTLCQLPAYAFRPEHGGALIGLAGSSAALWVADQPLIDGAQAFGRFLGLSGTTTHTTLVRIPFRLGPTNLPLEFNVPDNLNSTFYFIGDGWTHLSVATGFWVYGGLKKDNRAAQTASQLGTAIISTGVVVQTLKRATGRQSPYVATKDRGEWHLFPSFTRYQRFVPNYDAFPSGHLATAMATVTVVADNYAEYRFIRPLGYSLMGLLGYSMLNNGVHWASDYPLGLALGYAFGKLAVRDGRTRVEATTGPAVQGTGRAPRRPPRWYRQGQLAPYTDGPFAGASWTLRW